MINIELYPADLHSVTYILLPMQLDGLKQLALRYNTSIVAVTGIDWDNDLTPWAAPGVFRNDADFKGNAGMFLNILESKIIPAAENKLCLSHDVVRNLCGISLSGLFALWAWLQDDTFRNIAGISSSFWYDNFAAWLSSRPIPHKEGKAYFSLGNKEGSKNDNPRFQSVQADTAAVVDSLRRAGITVEYEATEGTHYAPPLPRIAKALQYLSD